MIWLNEEKKYIFFNIIIGGVEIGNRNFGDGAEQWNKPPVQESVSWNNLNFRRITGHDFSGGGEYT